MNMLFAGTVAFVRARPIVTACIVAAVLLAAANVLLWQQRQLVAQQHDEVRRKGELMLRALSTRGHVEADLAALEMALAHISRNVVDEQSMEVNLGYFYRMEKPARVRLVRLHQLAAPAAAPNALFKAVPFSMQVTGSYRSTMAFLRALETGPRLLRVRNVNFERSTSENGELVLDLTLEVLANA